MSFDPEYIYILQSNNLTQTSQRYYYRSIRNKKSVKYKPEVSLTRGKKHHGFRVHYIVTNTHPLVILCDVELFKTLFSSAQHSPP